MDPAADHEHWTSTVVLGDGNTAVIRPITPGDAPALEQFHSRQSPDSRYLRFFSPKPTLSEDELERFTTVDFVDRVFMQTDRSPQVLRNLASMYNHGRLGGTGYLSILPVDQGIEHSGAASFAPNPIYFDPKNIVELAVQAGCNAVATTFGVLGMVSRRYAHKIPFIVKINHNELLTYPATYDQVM